jgi:hypothetical protein
MIPNLSGRNRAARLFMGAAVFGVGAALWPGPPDLLCLVGVTIFMTGLVGACPLREWFGGLFGQAPDYNNERTFRQ